MTMQQALALVEFTGAAAGILATDRALKRAPVALLRCGTVHPGRYLLLVGGTVAATAEAHAAALAVARQESALADEVCLPDPHPQLADAVAGRRRPPEGDAAVVMELETSPGLVRAVDAVLKTVPVDLVELRLADDLGGRGLALVSGRLPDVQVALEVARGQCGGACRWLGGTLLPRLDDTLRDVLAEGTRFGACRAWEPAGAEKVEG
ncbi:MAG: BMC domain-containing protein [Candidatus Krumholzibacteriia bacterium]